MRAWYEVIKPREDILSGELNEAIFAANLADVLQGRAPLEYRDPAHFFQQTYPTQGLVNLLATVAKRLASGVGDSVIQLQTPFGGGKTHALISLYHLFRHGMQYRDAALVRQSLERAGLDALPEVRIACFVGEDADPLKGKTPWGALAEQLGVYPLVQEHDLRRRAPGRDLVLQMLGEQPTLILLDELAVYSVAAKDFEEQVLAFCQQLTEAVGVAPRAALVATLPSSAPYGDEGERALHQLEQIFGRVQALYTPVEGDEFFRVLRQRLMQEVVDPTELNHIVDAFFERYQHADVPEEARQDAYRERMRLAYPFHPLVIDTLDRRWSTYSTFQRTRGVLKFLASVLRDMYERQVNTPLILPAHLNLEYAPIRQELLRHIGNQYAGVISQDIAGAGANAVQIDQQLGAEYAPMRIASGLATAIFFGSFSAGEQVGVTEPELRLASLRPNLPPAVIGDALHKLTQKLWYLHSEGGLYAFRLTPNLNKILLEKEEQVRAQELAERIRKEVEARLGRETCSRWRSRTPPATSPTRRS
jgi:predicted AAA+ superfamily ATPase